MQVLITKIAETFTPACGHRKKTKSFGEPFNSGPGKWFCTPVLAPLLNNRWINCIFATFGVAQLLLAIAGLDGWQCPIHASVGANCPGCGMTAAMTMLLKGQWQVAVATHAFAPVALLVLILMLAAIALPSNYLIRICNYVDRLERKTGVTAILLLSMMLYWLLKIFDII